MDIVNLPSKQNVNIISPTIYKNAFNFDECQKIININGEFNHSSVQGSYKDSDVKNPDIRKSLTKYIKFNKDSAWIYQRISEIVLDINKNNYSFVIDTIQELQVLKYDEGGFFDWHIDLGFGLLATRKLSIIIFLSDIKSYQGGELKFQFANYVEQEQGNMLIFPSYLTHRVEKVISGERYTLVAWIHGSHFR